MTNKKESVLEDTKKQTAVEWLFEQVWITSGEDLPELLEQAKELEKKQIEDAFEKGADDIFYAKNKFEDGEQFYKETYGQ